MTLIVLSLTYFPQFDNQPTRPMSRHGKGFGYSIVTLSYKRKVTLVFFFRTRFILYVVVIFRFARKDSVCKENVKK